MVPASRDHYGSAVGVMQSSLDDVDALVQLLDADGGDRAGLAEQVSEKSKSWISRSKTPPPLLSRSLSHLPQAGAAHLRRNMGGLHRPQFAGLCTISHAAA